MNISSQIEAFEEAVARGLVSEEDFVRVIVTSVRDPGFGTTCRFSLDGRRLFDITYGPFGSGTHVEFFNAAPPHRPKSRLAAHEARWANATSAL